MTLCREPVDFLVDSPLNSPAYLSVGSLVRWLDSNFIPMDSKKFSDSPSKMGQESKIVKNQPVT